MTVALELGVREFRSLRRDGQRLFGRRMPCSYVVLPLGLAEQRLLDQARVPYSVCSGSLLVLGEPALDLASSLKLPCLTPFEEGQLPRGDAVARQVIATMIDTVLPPRPATTTTCVMTAPGQYRNQPLSARSLRTQFRESNASLPTISTAATLGQIVRLQGYSPIVLSASLAVGLAELGKDGLTGLALHFGAGECQASLLQQGHEIVHIGIPRGEDALIDQWARLRDRLVWDHEGNCYLHQSAVREWLDRARPSLVRPADDDAAAWRDLVIQLVNELIAACAPELSRLPGFVRTKTRLPVVYSGSLANAVGFDLILKAAVEDCGALPELAMRPAADISSAIVRGLLIYAEGMSGDETGPLADSA